MRRIRTGGSLIVVLVVIAAVVAIPLFTIYQSRCGGGGKGNGNRETRYSFVLPWNDPPEECRRHRNGFELVKDEIGL